MIKNKHVVLIGFFLPLVLIIRTILRDNPEILNYKTNISVSGGGTRFFYNWNDFIAYECLYISFITILLSGLYLMLNKKS